MDSKSASKCSKNAPKQDQQLKKSEYFDSSKILKPTYLNNQKDLAYGTCSIRSGVKFRFDLASQILNRWFCE